MVSSIAILGLGAMGQRMAQRLLAAGHKVRVWNRTAERAAPLMALGAFIAPTPKVAAQGAQVVIAMVRDDTASRAVWLDPETGALGGMVPGSVAIESSTLTPSWVRTLADHAQSTGVDFLDAPVAGSRAQAEAGQLIYFVGGARAVLDRVEPLLQTMGQAVHHVGETGSGAALKLAANALFGIQVTALAELIAMLREAGLDVPRAIEVLSATPICSPAAKGAAASMLSGAFAPMFPVELVEKDLHYALHARQHTPEHLPIVAAAHKVFTHALHKGMGGLNLTSVAALYEQPPAQEGA